MEINVIPERFEEAIVHYPFPTPFLLSSTEKDWCQKDWAKIVYIKRQHLQKNLDVISQVVGMDAKEQKRFLDYWCQPADYNKSVILAEKSGAFDIKYRAEIWMEKAQSNTKQTQKSRLEKYAESAQQFFGREETIPSSGEVSPGLRYADIPDEQ